MKAFKKIFCILTALTLLLAMALPAFAGTLREAPSGYDAHDYGKLLEFFERESRLGGTNGEVMNPDYDPDDPSTWTGIGWTDGGTKKLRSFSICKYGFAGALDLTDCTALETVDCSYSSLEGVDVSGCSSLTVLLCCVNEYVTLLDIEGCDELRTLNCSGTLLESLDVSEFGELKTLDCSDCRLTELTLGDLTKLERLECGANLLAELDVSGCSALTVLNCENNELTSLDVTENRRLATLFCSDNMLTELHVYKSGVLKSLICMNNKLSEIDLVGCNLGSVSKLSVSGNGFVGCDLSFNYPQANVVYAYAPAGSRFVKWVDANGEHLYSQPTVPYNYQEGYMTAVFEPTDPPEGRFDEHDAALLRNFFEQAGSDGVKNGEKLFFEDYDPDDPETWDEWTIFGDDDIPRVLWDSEGRVCGLYLTIEEEDLYGVLDVSGMDELTHLDCVMSKLTGVFCTGCAKLRTIELAQNEIESLDLTGCTSIELLNVAVNKLRSLDFDDCRGTLKRLWATHNEIEGELDLAGMPNIDEVFFNNNKLTRVSAPAECGEMSHLECAVNEITEAEVYAEARDISFGHNPMTKLHFVTRGNEVDIVSDGNGTFGCEYTRDCRNPQTGELYDYFDVTGTPYEGYEYMGLYEDGELMFEPNELYTGEAIGAMSLTAVFEGSAPAPAEPDPTEPGEPTEPSEPTEPGEPSEPSEPIPAPPVTGGMSFAFLGAVSVICGAAVLIKRRR